MGSRYYQRPENAISKADEFMKVGKKQSTIYWLNDEKYYRLLDKRWLLCYTLTDFGIALNINIYTSTSTRRLNIYNKLTCTYPRQTVSSFGHSLRCHQVQEEEPHLQREAHRGDHVPVPGALRGPQEVPRGQGGVVPVQEYVPGGFSPVNFFRRFCLFMTNCNAFIRARTLRA